LGLRSAERLAERGAKHLVLLGRHAPGETAREHIARLEQLGAAVAVIQADVSREGDMRRVLEQIRGTLPPLRGVIHAAGILDDGVLLNLTWERFERVFASKVAGAWNLHRLTREAPLDFFVLYSSTAALLGSPGQGNYAAANAFLDALAHHRRSRGLPGLSINWGAWSEVGLAAQHGTAERVAGFGMGVIDPSSGLAALERLLNLDRTQTAVIPADWSRLFAQGGQPPAFLSRLAGEVPGRATPKRDNEWAKRLQSAPPGNRRELLAEYVQQQAARVLGLVDEQKLDPSRSLFDLGMDSLMAVELRNRVQADLGGAFPTTLVFDHPTIEALAGRLSVAQPALPSSVLVPIQPEGNRPPFFCVHPAFGFVIGLGPLGRELGEDQPFYGFQARGLHETEQPLSSVQEMAALYRKALTDLQPEGPIYLGGWSAGGNIAFEMTRQLQRAGRHVALLVLLDSSARYLDSDLSDRTLIDGGIVALRRVFGRELEGQPEHQREGSSEEQFLSLLRRTSEVDLGLPGGLHNEWRVFDVLRATTLAVKAYQPHPCFVRTVLYRAAEQMEWAPKERALGWAEWIRGPLDVREAAGDHYTMVRPPHVETLAARLRACLVEARAVMDD
jgi:thioesterase domain-containing protein